MIIPQANIPVEINEMCFSLLNVFELVDGDVNDPTATLTFVLHYDQCFGIMQIRPIGEEEALPVAENRLEEAAEAMLADGQRILEFQSLPTCYGYDAPYSVIGTMGEDGLPASRHLHMNIRENDRILELIVNVEGPAIKTNFVIDAVISGVMEYDKIEL